MKKKYIVRVPSSPEGVGTDAVFGVQYDDKTHRLVVGGPNRFQEDMEFMLHTIMNIPRRGSPAVRKVVPHSPVWVPCCSRTRAIMYITPEHWDRFPLHWATETRRFGRLMS